MRLVDWDERLSEYLAEVRDEPFAWGEQDCALHAANAVAAITGEDFGAPFRGTYTTRAGSAQALRAHGKGTLLRTIDALFVRKAPSHAHRGDLVWFERSVGVCVGAAALFVGEERLTEAAEIMPRVGLVAIPRRLWLKAWAV